MKTLMILACGLLMLSGCSNEQAPSIEKVPAEDLVLKHQIQALDKAKQVETTLKQGEQARQKAMDEAGI